MRGLERRSLSMRSVAMIVLQIRLRLPHKLTPDGPLDQRARIRYAVKLDEAAEPWTLDWPSSTS
jgi:hypothetical protein